jgi:hypothetical protein
MSARPRRDPDAGRWWLREENDAAYDAFLASVPPGMTVCACHLRVFALEPVGRKGSRRGKR